MNFYPDEARDTSALKRFLAADFAADPEALLKYQGLQARDARHRARVAELEQKLKKAEDSAKRVERELHQTERKRRTLRDANADLTRRLGSAHGALEAYRKEAARLKNDLQRLRGSRSYRLGKRMVDPFGLRSRPMTPQEHTARPGVSSSPEGTEPTASSDAVTDPAATPPAGADLTPGLAKTNPHRKLSELSYAELLDWLEREPSPDSLKAVLSRSWYAEGQFSRPADLIDEHAELTAQLTGKDAALAERILGAAHAKKVGPPLPPRAQGPAFQTERGRIMYCAHSTAFFNTNGYSIRTHGLAKGLTNEAEDVFVVGRPGYPWDSATDVAKPPKVRHVGELDGVNYVHLPGSPLSGTRFDRYILEAADSYVREARLLRPSLIHSASNFWTALPALIASRRLGLPFVYEVRGLWEITEASDKANWDQTERYAQQTRLETLVATEADVVLAITEETKDELVRRGVPGDKITLAPNAVDTHSHLPLPKDEAYARTKDIHTDRPVIGFAGSMVGYEGLHLLLEAVAMLVQQEQPGSVSRFQVVLAGSGRAEGSLRDTALELGIADRVTFLGRVPNHEIPRLMSLFDIMPLPRLSLPVTEMVSPLKPLEALSAAKAVVLSDVSPHRVFAGTQQDRAVLFPAGNATALALVLGKLVADGERRAELGRAGRLWCLDNRTWSHVARDVVDAHRRALHEHEAAAGSGQARSLATLRVGLIADEFTTSTLEGTVQMVPLERATWADQLPGLDLIFVESAWAGNGGQWHRGIGRYSPEEHRDIVALLASARELGVPSVFWNKEDPVHFSRFVATASLCDHVFTTDAGRIPAYLEHGEGTVRTVSALPFYAQPKIHNPLPTDRPFEATVSYAGTYYGDRYPQRSRELASMLSAALPHGLTIYDRQAAFPESPYHFPRQFEPYVKGSLPYQEVLKSYKSHIASINVNSVADSPSMFSRRVVEIAASGGVVVSGPGRGASETFGSALPCTADSAEWRALFRAFSEDPQARLGEAWLQMRAVLRSHTVTTALTIVARTAGLPVRGPVLPTYALVLDAGKGVSEAEVVHALVAQSVLPSQVLLRATSRQAHDRLQAAGIRVVDDPANLSAEFIGALDDVRPRTWFEDLLLATRFGTWEGIAIRTHPDLAVSDPMAQHIQDPDGSWDLVSRPVLTGTGSLPEALSATGLTGLQLVKPVETTTPRSAAPAAEAASNALANPPARPQVLVAGHDLKFSQGFLDSLAEQGYAVAVDAWNSHSDHDEERSLALLESADIVFCEWGLGNAEWYSKHIGTDQRLVVRVHSQELRRPYLSRIRHDRVDAYIFVGELIREAAVRSHGVPRARTFVIPNGVSVDELAALPKHQDAHLTIGFVGILPQGKRLDLALDVLEGLQDHNPDYRMRIRGKLPSELPWLKARPDELRYFEEQFSRIDALNANRAGSVLVEGHGDDMVEWYRNVGIALSVSDFESFHLTIADGAASGALPALLAWPGSDLIYPRDWIYASTREIVKGIVSAPGKNIDARSVARRRFNASAVNTHLISVTLGNSGHSEFREL